MRVHGAHSAHGVNVPQIDTLVDQLKRALREQGITYADVAARLGLSESAVKRMFSKRAFSLQRFEDVCNTAGLQISDLVDRIAERHEYLTELSPAQEEALLADPKLLLMTYLLINGWQLSEITDDFEIDGREAYRLLLKLDRAKIIELLPFNRVKLLTARNFTWRKDGPVQKFFSEQVQSDFLSSTFSGTDERMRFVGGLLSDAALARMQQSIDRIAQEFDELARRDSALPIGQRRSAAAVFAIRRWEFSAFARLRRKPAQS
jgi:transcriptional regulator with XRE-family HTH domain